MQMYLCAWNGIVNLVSCPPIWKSRRCLGFRHPIPWKTVVFAERHTTCPPTSENRQVHRTGEYIEARASTSRVPLFTLNTVSVW